MKINHFCSRSLNIDSQTIIMGVLNVTPDSFSELGKYFDCDSAVNRAIEMIDDGARIIDIGGESSKPGAKQISIDEELQRVIPVIEKLSKLSDVLISIDTYKSEVAEKAIKAGAKIINDISGFSRDANMKNIASKTKAGCIVMHMRGTPETMQSKENLIYRNLLQDIYDFFKRQTNMLISCGVRKSSIIIDPGIGFSKNIKQNLTLIKKISFFESLGFPILLGVSKKSFIGSLLNLKDPADRLWGTAACLSYAIINGTNILRVHDTFEMSQISKMTDLLKNIT